MTTFSLNKSPTSVASNSGTWADFFFCGICKLQQWGTSLAVAVTSLNNRLELGNECQCRKIFTKSGFQWNQNKVITLSQVHEMPKCDTHGHFCLIFGNKAILTNSSTLISKIIVAKLISCAKVVFWGILLWRHCPNKEFSFL